MKLVVIILLMTVVSTSRVHNKYPTQDTNPAQTWYVDSYSNLYQPQDQTQAQNQDYNTDYASRPAQQQRPVSQQQQRPTSQQQPVYQQDPYQQNTNQYVDQYGNSGQYNNRNTQTAAPQDVQMPSRQQNTGQYGEQATNVPYGQSIPQINPMSANNGFNPQYNTQQGNSAQNPLSGNSGSNPQYNFPAGNSKYPSAANGPSFLYPESEENIDYMTGNQQYPGHASNIPVRPKVESPPSRITYASNNFALQMLKLLLPKTQENVVVSPFSLSTLLALLQQGAVGNSARQLASALGLNAVDSKKEISKLMTSINKRRSSNIVELANSLWLDKAFSLNSTFKGVANRDFLADVETLDFGHTGRAASDINSWVSRKTKGLITDLISPGMIDRSTAMILVNALYFKGLWKSPFAPDRTVNLTFNPTPSFGQKTPFMHQSGAYVAGEDKTIGARWLELPFEDNLYSMVFILPIEQHGLEELVERLSVNDLNMILNWDQQRSKVTMSIPKFKIGFETQLDNLLKQMGLTDIFTRNSGLQGVSTNLPVYVSKALQKAAITVDEYGSTAAAATSLSVNTLSLSGYYDEFRFFANQPFLAVIMDKVNKVPLFFSRINNPVIPRRSQKY